jgi:hypothetical protein
MQDLGNAPIGKRFFCGKFETHTGMMTHDLEKIVVPSTCQAHRSS